MKKQIYLALLCIIICTALTSCGTPKPPQEDDIMKNLPEDITTVVIGNPFDELNIYAYDMDARSVLIEKRQTNEKEDTAYCAIELENEYYQFTKYLKMNYNYYDKGGWILDDYSEYKAMDWKIIDCPLSAEDVAYVCDYSQVEYKETIEDFATGAVTFYFDVEGTHANGAYKGTIVIDCQFDGEEWSYTKNTEDVHFIWDIIGTWKYSWNEDTSYYSTVHEIEVKIQNFDQSAGTMNGSWYMYSNLAYNNEMISLDDAEHVKVGVGTDRAIVELWENPNYWGMHSYVRFYPDSVEAAYATHFGPVHLERTDDSSYNPVQTSNSSDTTNAEDIATWNQLIEQYFAIMETNDQDAIYVHRLKSGPYGDEIGIMGEHLQQYKVTNVEHSSEFYPKAYEEIGSDIEAIKHTLKELTPDFDISVDDIALLHIQSVDDIALLHVQAEFSNHEIGIVEYQFWFVKGAGTTWILGSADIQRT